MWVGTEGGVSLYQAGAWQTFTAENSPLAPGGVTVLLEDSQGRIWVGTDYYDSAVDTSKGGVSVYAVGAWQTFTAEDSLLAPGGVSALLEDTLSRIWVGTSEGVSVYAAGTWQTFTAEDSPLAPGGVTELLEDSQGRIWVGTEGGVSVYAVGAWQTFTAKDSPLTPGWVGALLEDSQGRIWVGTEGGVSVYTAGTWQTFTSDSSSLAPGWVIALLEDAQGRIWVGTGKGLSLYQDRNWQTFTAKNSPLASGGVWELLEDSQGRIWVGTYNWLSNTGGVSLYHADTWQTFAAENSPLAPGGVWELLEDSQGHIWVGTDGGLSLYQVEAWQTFTSDNSPLAPGVVQELLEDSQGRIWARTEGGLGLYQVGTWQTFMYDNSPLAPGWVNVLLEDSQGRMWAGTYGGLSLYQAGAWQTFTAENSPLAPGWVNRLLEDAQGRIWVGTGYYDSTTRGGVSVYAAGAWQTFTSDNSPLAPGGVLGLLEDSQGHIWIGTSNGLSLYRAGAWQTFTSDNSPLAPGEATVLLEDSQGRIWARTSYYDSGTDTYKSGISFYQVGTWQTFTSDNSPLALGGVTALLEDSQGRIWVGTGGGLSLYQAGAWQTFTSDNSPLALGGVTALLEDSQGRIWVGTGGGLSLYQAGAWQTFTSDNSPLAPGEVWELLDDSQGRIWARTKGGLSLYQVGAWQTFTADNSLLAPGWVNVLLEDAQGRMWVGTSGGVSIYAAGTWQSFTSDNSSLAPGWVTVLLEGSQGRIWVGTADGISVRRHGDRPCAFLRYAGPAPGQTSPLRPTSALTFTFPSPNSTLVVGFSGIDAESNTDRLLFRCQLIGHDEEEAPCASPVHYAALPPGTYTFRVRALDEDLRSSEPATATITLISTAPPTPTPTPAPTPTPYVVERERVVSGLPREAIVPLTGGLGGLAIVIVLGIIIRSKIRRARHLAAWCRGADPYVVGSVIEEPQQFYGREEALTELLHALEAGNHVALYGERRIGKTSLLHQLAHRLRNLPHPAVHFLPVFVNLQMVPEPRFFSVLAGAIAKAARRELEQHGQSLPALRVDGQREGYDSLDLADDLDAIVEALQEAIGQPPRIVLLLDEADKMNRYDPHTQEALRGLLMTPVGKHVELVWSGQAMNREWHLESSPWYNLFKQELRLGGLAEEAATRLIQKPVRRVFTYEDEAVRCILELTDQEPYPIQRLCSFCVRRLLREKRFRISADDVKAAWQDMQAEDARRAAEGATDLNYRPGRPAWAVAEKGTKYHTGKEDEA
jgi:ligand-binding sensor domain-containing protein